MLHASLQKKVVKNSSKRLFIRAYGTIFPSVFPSFSFFRVITHSGVPMYRNVKSPPQPFRVYYVYVYTIARKAQL